MGGRYWGTVGSGAFGTHQRVTLARVPQWFPQLLACSQIVRGESNEKTLEESVEEAVSTRCLHITKVTRINQNLTS